MLTAAVVGSAGLVLAQATPAAAVTTICSAYTNGEVWMTSTRWGRVRERVCLEYTSTSVRGKVSMQVDYPLSSCSLTVGLPPSGSISCPVTRPRVENLDFDGTKIRVGFKRGNGTIWWGWCEAGSWSAGWLDTMTRSCHTPYFADRYRSYRVYASDVMGDVRDDGAGWKVLAPVSRRFANP